MNASNTPAAKMTFHVETHRVDAHDPLVGQAPTRLRLAPEALEEVWREAPVGVEQLERDPPTRGGLLGLVDRAHPAAPELGDDAIRPHALGPPADHCVTLRARRLEVVLDQLA